MLEKERDAGLQVNNHDLQPNGPESAGTRLKDVGLDIAAGVETAEVPV